MIEAPKSSRILQNAVPILRDKDVVSEDELFDKMITIVAYTLVITLIVGTVYGIYTNYQQVKLAKRQLADMEKKEADEAAAAVAATKKT